MIQCSYQITKFLFAINRQEGRAREKGMQFSLVEKKIIKLLVDQDGKKEHFVVRSLIYPKEHNFFHE
jgi:hypothetical protein